MELIYDNVQDDTNYPIITFEAFLQELRESYFNLKEESIDHLFLLACEQEPHFDIEMEENDAYDFISGEKIQNNEVVFLLDDVFTQPLQFETMHNLIVFKQNKNPFTREEIKRIIKVELKYRCD